MKKSELRLFSDRNTAWICIQSPDVNHKNSKPWFRHDTVSYSRKSSINLLLGEGTMNWVEAKKFGWVCCRVNIETRVI